MTQQTKTPPTRSRAPKKVVRKGANNGDSLHVGTAIHGDKDETCSMLLPKAKSTGPWPDNVIKPYGIRGITEGFRINAFL